MCSRQALSLLMTIADCVSVKRRKRFGATCDKSDLTGSNVPAQA